MNNSFAFVLAVLILIGNQIADAQSNTTPSAEEVLMKYVEVTGGADAYKAIESSRTTGNLSVTELGLKATIQVTTSRPNKFVANITIENVGEQKQVCDGVHCWETSTMNGTRLITGVEASQLRKQTNAELIYKPKEFFKTMDNKGIEEVNGENCYRILLVSLDGQTSENFYSVDSGLLHKSVTEHQTPMGPLKMESYSTAYQPFNGILTPTNVEQHFSNGMVQIVSTEKVEYNIDVPEDAFQAPEGIQKMIDKAEKEAKPTGSVANEG